MGHGCLFFGTTIVRDQAAALPNQNWRIRTGKSELANQIWTDHYYNAYPMASSNDVKSAMKVRNALLAFMPDVEKATPDEFQQKYNRLLLSLQHDISQMDANPVVSLAASSVERRLRREKGMAVRNT